MTKDGTKPYYKDWGEGQPVVFSHGWPLSSNAWEDQMCFLAARGCRCIAHDRRGYGRSEQPWNGNDMNTHADDLAGLVRALDLKAAVHVGYFSGAGEAARYAGRYGSERVSKVVLIGAIPALVSNDLSTQSNDSVPAFDQILPGCSRIERNSSGSLARPTKERIARTPRLQKDCGIPFGSRQCALGARPRWRV
jgi:non-heme chloroperoxidase